MKNHLEYLPVLLLGLAVLFNLVSSELYPDDYYVWYHVTHKLQITLVAFAGLTYKSNRINRFAFVVYISIIILNWIIYSLFSFGGGHSITAIAFIVAIFIVNIIEPKGKV